MHLSHPLGIIGVCNGHHNITTTMEQPFLNVIFWSPTWTRQGTWSQSKANLGTGGESGDPGLSSKSPARVLLPNKAWITIKHELHMTFLSRLCASIPQDLWHIPPATYPGFGWFGCMVWRLDDPQHIGSPKSTASSWHLPCTNSHVMARPFPYFQTSHLLVSTHISAPHCWLFLLLHPSK